VSALEEVDRRLAAWAEWLKRVDDSLLVLEAEPTYQVLAGSAGRRAPLDGISHARVSPALDALADLFEHRQRLEGVFCRAKDLRASITALGFFQNDDKLRQIRELLDGPSIHMGAMEKPLAQRSLLDAGAEDVLVSPEQLLVAMQRAYEGARDAVLAVERAWATLEPALERMEAELAALRAMAAQVGESERALPELVAIAAELAAARTRIARDPLGATGSVEGALAPRIGAVRGALTALAGHKERVTAGLATAVALRRELGETHVRARAVRSSTLAELAGATLPELVPDDALDGLDAWREKLEQTAAAHRWASAAVGLTRWEQICGQYLATDRGALAAADRLAARKDELRGRLSARMAQLRALQARGLPRDSQLEQLARDAEARLAKRPLALDALEITVASFEGGVVDAARRAK
jgi:hypothetical protein